LGHSDDIYGDGYIKGLATNDENLYALVHSCLKPDSNEYAGLGILCKDYIYVWKLDTLMSLAEEGLSGANIPIDTSMSLGVFHWHSSISANGDYVYLGDDAWGTGIVVVDFSDYNNPKKVHSYGRTIDQYPSGEVKGSGIATNDDFIVVSTAGKPIFQGDIIGYGDGDDGVYVGKIDGDDDDVPLGKDAFPDWKYINSKWDLYAFLVLILGLPSSIHEGWSKIAFQRVRKAEDRAEAELHITKLKDTIDKLKSKGIETANLEKVLAQCEAEMEFATSFSFRKAGKMAQKSLTEAKGLKSEHKTIGKKIDIIKEKIMEFKEKGINTEELEKVLEKTETT